jgi:1-acyl-sn-glycerol-3-phosphate acyltransferase
MQDISNTNTAELFPHRGSRFGPALARWLLALAGWRVAGALPPCPRFVVIVAPHTSSWDFLFAVLAMFATDLRISWLGKHTIFRFPFGPMLRWLGGEPVDRSAAARTVSTAIDQFRARPQWVLGLAPEGTRRRVDHWKSGFHRIAVGAGVPIVPVWIDYQAREVGIGAPFTPGANEAADVAALRALFRKEMARHPERFAE